MASSSMEQFNHIEDKLNSKLLTLQPNPAFVHNLRNRLVDKTGIQMESRRSKPRVLIATTAVLGFFAIILWLVFYIASFFREDDL